MKCPSCKHEFKLTVREYVREPRGRHNCPACSKRFRLKYSFSYIAIMLLVALLFVVGPAVVVFHFSQSLAWYIATVIVCSVIFLFPADMWLDDKWRESAEL
jgi:hypothetical protein